MPMRRSIGAAGRRPRRAPATRCTQHAAPRNGRGIVTGSGQARRSRMRDAVDFAIDDLEPSTERLLRGLELREQIDGRYSEVPRRDGTRRIRSRPRWKGRADSFTIVLAMLFCAAVARFYHRGRLGFTAPSVSTSGTVRASRPPGRAALSISRRRQLRRRVLRTARTGSAVRDPAIDRGMDMPPSGARRILLQRDRLCTGLGRPVWILEASALQNVACWAIMAVLLTSGSRSPRFADWRCGRPVSFTWALVVGQVRLARRPEPHADHVHRRRGRTRRRLDR